MEENKQLDEFIRKTVKEAGLEEPAIGFTDAIMSKIESVNQAEAVSVTKPLFSKFVWFFIVAAVVGVFGYVILNGSDARSTWLAAVKLNKLTSFNLSLNMPELNYSTAFIYGSMAIALFAWLHVLLLKQHFFKKAYS